MNMSKMITFVAVAASAAIPMAANADTIEINGVVWTYVVNNATAKTVTLGGGTASTLAMATDTAFDAAVIPWTFDVDGETYTVTAIAAQAFNGCTKLTGTLTIPMAVTSIGRAALQNTGLEHIASLGGVTSLNGYVFEKSQSLTQAFPDISRVTSFLQRGVFYGSKFSGTAYIGKNASISPDRTFASCSNLEGICAPGPDAVVSGTQTYTTINVGLFAESSTNMKVIFFGPNTKGDTMTNGTALRNVTGCKVYVPANGYWDGLVAGGIDTDVVYYGASTNLDLSVDTDLRVTVTTPTDGDGLVKALEAAPLFKTHFGWNTHICVTNTIDLTDVTITEDMVSGATFDRLMFSAKTQTQLNAILGAFPATTPISIDPTGLTENMVIPETYANVFVKTVPGVTIKRTTKGFMIIVK